MWLYGSGFPKSMNIGLAIDKRNGVESKVIGYEKTSMPDFRDVGKKKKEISGIDKLTFGQIENSERKQQPIYEAQNKWNGWGTCLKPAYEPIIVARKPIENSVVDNVLKYGVGGINIDECRVENTNADSYDLEKRGISKAKGSDNDGYFLDKLHNQDAKHGVVDNGRFPSNVILTYDEIDYEEVCGGFKNCQIMGYEDEGNASRYFYCAKASKKDRDEGLDEFEIKGAKELLNREENSDGASWNGKYSSGNAYARAGCSKKNIHPTVKPTELIQYLIRLVSPKGATILDCFNGSGTTGKAVMFENKERNANYKYIGIELTEEYLPISKARIEWVINNNFEFYQNEDGKKDYKKVNSEYKTLNIFDFLDEE